MLERGDAGLLIGDSALSAKYESCEAPRRLLVRQRCRGALLEEEGFRKLWPLTLEM